MRRPDRELEKLREDLQDLEGRVQDLGDDLTDARREFAERVSEESEAREQANQEGREFASDLIARALHAEVIAAVLILVGLVIGNLPLLVC